MTAVIAALNVQEASHATPGEWLWCVVLLIVPLLVTAAVFVRGTGNFSGRLALLIDRPAAGLEAATGRPAWSSAGVEIGVWALTVAAVGFFWDVAWHIDLGRDQQLFTPPHTLIVAGLIGIAAAGIVSTVIATRRRADVGIHLGSLRIPWGAAVLIALGAFATVGFPTDALYHATYGVDVTMWSATHLTMISGAAFAPLGVWLLYREGGVESGRTWARRAAMPLFAGALAVALAAFQLEFDDGVPQWQMLFQPVLIALAATFALTAVRVALGPGWALVTAAMFLLIRGTLTLIVGVALGHVVTHFPLYIGIAVCVEAGMYITRARRPLVQALTVGVLSGTAGLATEWGWNHLWSYQQWQPRLLPSMWVALLAAVAAAVLALGAGAVLRGARPRLPAVATTVAGLAVVVSLIIPFPRNNIAAVATVDTQAVGAPRPATDRFGVPSPEQDVLVSVRVTPAAAAEDADFMRVTAWQGGGLVLAPMQETAPGLWRASSPVPTGGAWKTLVILTKGDVLAATPVAMPNDPEYSQPAIALTAQRTAPLQIASSLLMRETHNGTPGPQVIADVLYALELVIALGLVLLGYTYVERERAPAGRRTATRVVA